MIKNIYQYTKMATNILKVCNLIPLKFSIYTIRRLSREDLNGFMGGLFNEF